MTLLKGQYQTDMMFVIHVMLNIASIQSTSLLEHAKKTWRTWQESCGLECLSLHQTKFVKYANSMAQCPKENLLQSLESANIQYGLFF